MGNNLSLLMLWVAFWLNKLIILAILRCQSIRLKGHWSRGLWQRGATLASFHSNSLDLNDAWAVDTDYAAYCLKAYREVLKGKEWCQTVSMLPASAISSIWWVRPGSITNTSLMLPYLWHGWDLSSSRSLPESEDGWPSSSIRSVCRLRFLLRQCVPDRTAGLRLPSIVQRMFTCTYSFCRQSQQAWQSRRGNVFVTSINLNQFLFNLCKF